MCFADLRKEKNMKQCFVQRQALKQGYYYGYLCFIFGRQCMNIKHERVPLLIIKVGKISQNSSSGYPSKISQSAALGVHIISVLCF